MKFKVAIFISLLVLFGITLTQTVSADTATDNALNFLKSKQDATGRITTGFSAPSQWSAIAFAINGINSTTIKNPTVSLQDFLVSDVPASPSAATDWETRILAIVATGKNPTDFGGTNYVTNLESFSNNGQIGDTCSLNDDVFGLLALIAAGPASDTQIKQDVLHFLITKEDATDGGFSFSAPGCSFYGTSADMTGAALQALVEAKNNGLTDPGLDNAIDKTKAYLLANQDADGGFGYFGSSDTDTTGWVLQGFNVAGMKDSPQAASASAYLLSQQSTTDGGIMAFDFATNTFVSNASTTAQALIALSGQGWIPTIFNPQTAESVSATPTPTVTTTPTPTVTPTPTPTSSPSEPTATPTPFSTQTIADIVEATPTPADSPIPTAIPDTPAVLGAQTSESHTGQIVLAVLFFGAALVSLGLYIFKKFF